MSEPKKIIIDFLNQIRSGRSLERVRHFLHDPVIAHQIQSELEYSVERSPEDYASHIQEMLDEYGQFSLEIQEILAEENKVYVRWKQVSNIPDTKKITEIASAVYLIRNGKISEYWIQIDRKGLELQGVVDDS
ncbi:ester cyclase [Acinetobacter stercoris]|uniref:SnoaL-like polyketide cyclase n=1 Tax=Acinetobacter stercoris TaxID=2126983 RepID=A0A2U3N1Y7_9GAMM|nr:ester cyclase [Acinetobacter stercoris]SPL71706.1 SnoaL-like polyketide cyclase [Acinetobacter stercoris]